MRRHGAFLAQTLQRARPARAGGGDALGASADLHRRGAQRCYRCGAVAARRVGPAVRVVDPGPLGGLLGREGHRHEAQPGERGAARGRTEVAPGRDLVRGAGGPAVRAQKGAIERLYTAPPAGGVVVCLDEMGPQSARSYPGRRVVKPAPPKAQRAKQEIDYGRRGKGYVFGAFRPQGRPSPKPTRTAPLRTGSISSALSEAGSTLGSNGSTRWWTISTSTAPPMSSCSRLPTRAGSSCSSPSMPPT